MNSLWQTRIILLVIMMLSLLSFLAVPSRGTMAQGGPLPTPTNIGDGGGQDDDQDSDNDDDDDKDKDRATPRPPGARVSGFVYDYSSGGYAGGVKVVLDVGGWQAETVTDSNGFYQIGNLGFGSGLVNLRLPPGAHPLGSDWPVLLRSGADLRVDLGFYWGEAPTLPVKLSGNLANNNLAVQLENHTAETATGGRLEIELPASLTASPAVQASQGSVYYGAHRLQVELGDLRSGAEATVNIPIKTQAVPPYAQSPAQIRLLFTYDQQPSPQLVQLESNHISQEADLARLTSPAAPSTSASAPVPPTPAFSTGKISPLPVTGRHLATLQPVQVLLPLLVGLTLGAAGWYALRTKR